MQLRDYPTVVIAADPAPEIGFSKPAQPAPVSALTDKERRALEYLAAEATWRFGESIGIRVSPNISSRRSRAATGSAVARALIRKGLAEDDRGIPLMYQITEAGRAALAETTDA